MSDKNDAARLQHEVIGAVNLTAAGFTANTSKKTEWFRKPNLGLFVHYGISTVSSEVDLSWGMIKNKPWDNYEIAPNRYFKLAERFHPVNFEPEEWICAAKKAGFSYAVFTTKHHDGFALWPSKYGDYNIGRYLPNTDLVKKFVDACRKYDMHTGLYYSPPDWYYNREYMSFDYHTLGFDCTYKEGAETILDADYHPAVPKEMPKGWMENFREYLKNQICELLTDYGPIDILWFDGGSTLGDIISIEEIRKLQPGILLNPRLHSCGDFETFECRLPEEKPTGLWEHEDIWAEGPWWAYMKQSKQYKSARWLVEEYKKTAAMGGNFLINVGPMCDGTMPDVVYQRLDEVEKLLK